jgi:hypothetical protein
MIHKEIIYMQTPRIDDFPLLTEQLGKARTDRIRYAQQGTGRRQATATNINNTVQEKMLELEYAGMNYEVDDILSCAATTASGNSSPLNRHRLAVLFQTLPIINTQQIQQLTNLGERQARTYLRAAKFALPFLVEHFKKRPH